MNKFYCDKCGAETEVDNARYFTIGEYGFYFIVDNYDTDLCDNCLSKLEEDLKNVLKGYSYEHNSNKTQQ